MRTIVIGDVHGCLEECRELITRLEFRPGEDRLVFAGDLIDKGPDPVGVVRYVRSLGAECILGNHEEKAFRWFRHEDRRRQNSTYRNPMKVDPERVEQWLGLSAEDVAWLRDLPLTLQLSNNFIAVHGGFLPGIPIKEQPVDKIVRLRWVDAAGEFVPLQKDTLDMPDFACPWMDVWDGDCNVVYGHVVHGLENPRIDVTEKGFLLAGIDTGCVHGGRLTAMIITSGQDTPSYVSVKARRVYQERPTSGE